MIGHIGFYIENLQESDKFYRPLLKVIDYEVIFSLPQCIAYGCDGIPLFEIYSGEQASSGIHLAFLVKDKQTVDTFHSVALSVGGKDNGKPGYRDYTPTYYASFIIDPNGHNLEAFLEYEHPL